MTVDRIVLGRAGEGGTLEVWSDLPAAHELPHILWAGEIVRYVFSASLPRMGRPASRGWLVVLTDQRVICLKGRRGSAPVVKDIVYDALTEVTNRARILKATVTLRTGVGKLRLRFSRAEAYRLVQAITALQRGQVVPALPILPAPRDPAAPATLNAAQPFAKPLPPALTSPDQQRYSAQRIENLEAAVDRLEADVASLKQQIEFLEQLLKTRV